MPALITRDPGRPPQTETDASDADGRPRTDVPVGTVGRRPPVPLVAVEHMSETRRDRPPLVDFCRSTERSIRHYRPADGESMMAL